MKPPYWREKWLPVVGYEGLYDVSDLGRVRSYRVARSNELASTTRIIGGGISVQGYPKACLTKDGVQSTVTIHTILMRAFVGPPPEGQEVRHLDGIRTHSYLSNLAYGTRQENTLDRERHNPRTHCKHGHEFTPDNVYVSGGGRSCKTCVLARGAARPRKGRAPKPQKTHCLRGHEYTAENTYIRPDGVRICRVCSNAKSRAWKAANRRSRAA